MNGNVFDINRFAIHDGEGIRSTLFVKGCPLDCPWCQNPEGKNKNIELWHFANKCIRCAVCISVCPQKALSMTEKGIAVDKKRCDLCGKCADACPALALKFDACSMSVRQALDELMADKRFYDVTNGGITLSGGEPTVNPEFCLQILRECKKRGINTAVETCLYTDEGVLLKFKEVVDTFYTDIKIFDNEKHRSVIGVSNKKILCNFKALAKAGTNIIVRIPLIPGFTADVQNLRDIGEFVSKVNTDIPVELINFNPLAENKYAVFTFDYPIKAGTKPYSKAEMEGFRDIIKQCGVKKVL